MDEALINAKSPLNFHIETFGNKVLGKNAWFS